MLPRGAAAQQPRASRWRWPTASAPARVSQVASAAAVRGFLDDYYATSRRLVGAPLGAAGAGRHQLVAARADHAQRRALRQGPRLRLHLQRADPQGPRGAPAARRRRAHLPAARAGAGAADRRPPRAPVRPSSPTSAARWAPAPTSRSTTAAWPAEVGEIYLLATDGAYAHLDAHAVHDALARCGDDFDAAARRAGGRRAGARQRRRRDGAAAAHRRAAGRRRRARCRRSARAWRSPPPLSPRAELRGLHARARAARQLAQPCAPGGGRRHRAAGGAEDCRRSTCATTRTTSTASCSRNGWRGASTARTCSRPARSTGRAGTCTSRWNSSTARRWRSG